VKVESAVLRDRAIRRQSHYFIYRLRRYNYFGYQSYHHYRWW